MKLFHQFLQPSAPRFNFLELPGLVYIESNVYLALAVVAFVADPDLRACLQQRLAVGRQDIDFAQ